MFHPFSAFAPEEHNKARKTVDVEGDGLARLRTVQIAEWSSFTCTDEQSERDRKLPKTQFYFGRECSLDVLSILQNRQFLYVTNIFESIVWPTMFAFCGSISLCD